MTARPSATEDEVLAYLRERHASLYKLAAWTRAEVRAADPDFTEHIYRGWDGIGFRHPEAGYVCAVYPREERVELLFEHGASLVDPEGLLTGSGTQTRVYPITEPTGEARDAIRMLVQQAVAQRLR